MDGWMDRSLTVNSVSRILALDCVTQDISAKDQIVCSRLRAKSHHNNSFCNCCRAAGLAAATGFYADATPIILFVVDNCVRLCWVSFDIKCSELLFY